MSRRRQRLGDFGENVAEGFLRQRGFQILETKVRTPLGEIDLVATKEKQLVFVEVRTKQTKAFGSPEESITPAKARRLVSLAELYVQTHSGPYESWRIDVLAIELSPYGRVERIELIEQAIAADV